MDPSSDTRSVLSSPSKANMLRAAELINGFLYRDATSSNSQQQTAELAQALLLAQESLKAVSGAGGNADAGDQQTPNTEPAGVQADKEGGSSTPPPSHQEPTTKSVAVAGSMEERLEKSLQIVQDRIKHNSESLLPIKVQKLWDAMLKQDSGLVLPDSVKLDVYMSSLSNDGILATSVITPEGEGSEEVTPILYVVGFRGMPKQEMEVCNICCDIEADVRLSPCRHIVCRQCLLQMRQQLVYSPHSDVHCPFCRHTVKEYYEMQELREYEQNKILLANEVGPGQQHHGGGGYHHQNQYGRSSHRDGNPRHNQSRGGAGSSGDRSGEGNGGRGSGGHGHDRRGNNRGGNRRKGGGSRDGRSSGGKAQGGSNQSSAQSSALPSS